MPNVMVLGSGAFGKCLGHEDGALMDEINALMTEIPSSSLALLPACGALCEPESRLSADTESTGTFISDFPDSRTVSKTFLLLISHSVYSTLLQQQEQTKTLVLQVAYEKGEFLEPVAAQPLLLLRKLRTVEPAFC